MDIAGFEGLAVWLDPASHGNRPHLPRKSKRDAMTAAKSIPKAASKAAKAAKAAS